MACYKCQSEDELSAKKIDRAGTITFICKPCRRADYHRRPPVNPSKTGFTPVSKEWIAWAKEKNGEIANKHRDDSFLTSRGLL